VRLRFSFDKRICIQESRERIIKVRRNTPTSPLSIHHKAKGRRHFARGLVLSKKLPDHRHHARHRNRIRVVNHERVRARNLDVYQMAVIQIDDVRAGGTAKA
jgi:hypothetical protein